MRSDYREPGVFIYGVVTGADNDLSVPINVDTTPWIPNKSERFHPFYNFPFCLFTSCQRKTEAQRRPCGEFRTIKIPNCFVNIFIFPFEDLAWQRFLHGHKEVHEHASFSKEIGAIYDNHNLGLTYCI